MATIKKLHAREIIDSRGNPTIEVDLYLDDGRMTRASVPSGASTGKKEAVELRDGDTKRFNGLGVLKAVNNVKTELNDLLIGKDVSDQDGIDKLMIEADGTANKSRLGANAILGVSLAVLKAGALVSGQALYTYVNQKYNPDEKPMMPIPFLNILNGGKHANKSSDFQEYKIAPVGAPNFAEAIRWSSEVFHALKKILSDKGQSTSVGDEGGFSPSFSSNVEYIEVILLAIEKAGYVPGKDIFIALDPAASSFYENGKYILTCDKLELDSQGMIDYWADWIGKYPIISLEDGLAEDDWASWIKLNALLGEKVQIMGDDIFVTDPKIIAKAIEEKLANSSLIKVNQIGSVTETAEAVKLAKKAGWTAVFSHRSGETEDTTIADMVVGLATGMIKTGSISRTERVAKYNQLLRINEELGDKAIYPGLKAFYNIKKYVK
jgi:enolase